MHIYKPEFLKIEQLIQSRSEFYLTILKNVGTTKVVSPSIVLSKNLTKYTDYCYWFIYKILCSTYLSGTDNTYHFANIPKSVILQKIPASSYLIVIQILEILNIIEVNENYSSVGASFSKSYRLKKEWLDQRLIPHTVTNQKLLSKLCKPEVEKEVDETSFLYKWILNSDAKEKIDLSKLPFVTYQKQSISQLELDAEAVNSILENETNTTRYNRYLIASTNFNDKKVKVSGKCFKVIHSLSYLPKTLRHCIKGDFTIYDYSSSHTLHLLKLLSLIINAHNNPVDMTTALKEQKELDSILDSRSNGFSRGSIYYELSRCIISDELPHRFVYNNTLDYEALATEVKELIELISTESFYTHLNHLLNTDKEESKAIWLTGFLYRSKKVDYSILKTKFPAINSVLEWFQDYKKESKHTLASILQSSESYLVNQIIIGAVASQYPDGICLNLYDGFFTNVDLAGIIEIQSLKYFGFMPVVSATTNPILVSLDQT